MAREDGNGNGGVNAALSFGIGLVTGVALGVGLGLLMAPKEGRALRRDLGARASKLKDATVDGYRRVSDVAGQWTDRGKEVAERVRTAAAEGLREARKESATPRGPRNAELEGVEGPAENV